MTFDILQYKPVVTRVLRKLRVSSQEREDMTQECYLVLLQIQNEIREMDKDSAEKYAFASCKNRLITLKTGEQRTLSMTTPQVEKEAMKVHSVEPEVPEWEQYADNLPKATILNMLPPAIRETVELVVESGLSQVAAAQKLGVTRETVNRRMKSAARYLRNIPNWERRVG